MLDIEPTLEDSFDIIIHFHDHVYKVLTIVDIFVPSPMVEYKPSSQ